MAAVRDNGQHGRYKTTYLFESFVNRVSRRPNSQKNMKSRAVTTRMKLDQRMNQRRENPSRRAKGRRAGSLKMSEIRVVTGTIVQAL